MVERMLGGWTKRIHVPLDRELSASWCNLSVNFPDARYDAKRVLLRQGHYAHNFYFILSGSGKTLFTSVANLFERLLTLKIMPCTVTRFSIRVLQLSSPFLIQRHAWFI
jgi:hypothetical protein